MEAADPLLDWAEVWEIAFERCARAYSENVGPVLASLGESAVERAALRRGDRVLDVASGPGFVTGAAAMRVGSAGFAVGIDSSPTMSAIAVEGAARRARSLPIRFVTGTARSSPFPDKSFDAVISAFGLPFTGSGGEFEEALRVLAPGGRLSIVHFGPNFVEPMRDLSAIMRRHRTQVPSPLLAKYRDLSHQHEKEFHRRRAPELLREQVERAGFVVANAHAATVRQRLWGIMNFVDFALSFPLNHIEYEEMPAKAREPFHAACQEELKRHMALEEFIAAVELVDLTAERPA